MKKIIPVIFAPLVWVVHPLAQPADLVFKNGKVVTMDQLAPGAEAVAVSGNKIVCVGSNADAQKWVGPKTEVVNLQGKLLLPSFNDAHCHLVSGGFPATTRGDLNGDGFLTSADIVLELNLVFLGVLFPVSPSQGDVNCDGLLNSADVVLLLNKTFLNSRSLCST